MAPFTKQMLLDDFGLGIRLFANEMGRVLPWSLCLAMHSPEGVDEGAAPFEVTNAMPAAGFLGDAYDFAFNGRLRDGPFRDESSEFPAVISLFDGLNLAVAYESSDAFHLCSKTLRIAELRFSLFHPRAHETRRGPVWNHVTLLELAELANLDDKTLRNMTSPRHPRHLRTLKIDGRTYVSMNVAIPWLEARGFKPTVTESYRPDRDFKRDEFLSNADLAEYLQRNRERMEMSQGALARAVGRDVDAIRGLEDAEDVVLDPEFLRTLANALGLHNQSDFVSSAMTLRKRWDDQHP